MGRRGPDVLKVEFDLDINAFRLGTSARFDARPGVRAYDRINMSVPSIQYLWRRRKFIAVHITSH